MSPRGDAPPQTASVDDFRDSDSGEPAIAVRALSKRFGRTEVLHGIDLEVPRNAVFGFLGPNGAGKTTTMKILVGLLRASGGTASVLGHDVRRDGVAARACIGYLPQDVSYWRHLTVRQVLQFTARRYVQGRRTAIREQVDHTIELAGLADPFRSRSRSTPSRTHFARQLGRIRMPLSLTSSQDRGPPHTPSCG